MEAAMDWRRRAIPILFLLAGAALCCAQDAGTAAAWKALGAARAGEGRLEAAVEPFQRACELDPKDEDTCYYLGRALFALNRYTAAVSAFDRALHAASRDTRWRVHRAMARNYEVLGRAGEAERHFRESIRLRRGQPQTGEDPRIDYGAFLFRQGRAEEAVAPLEQAAATPSAPPRAFAELGRVLLELGRAEGAAARLEAAIALNPRDWPVHLLLGKTYYRLGREADGDRETRLGHDGMMRQSQGSSTVR
jgi:tetratricopeptide (TPR) repeat protein